MLCKVGMVALSVVVLTKNGSSDLERMLPALYGQKCIPPFEVIAVDSGSTDGTVDLLRRYRVRLHAISADAFHHARTRNLAASLASGEILIFLSQDAVPASDVWLNKIVANFDDPNVGAVYGRQLPKPGASSERQFTLDTVYGTQKFVKDPVHRNGMGYRFYHFSDVNAAIRRSAWEATRFPDDLKVFEDIGIAKRLLDGGWKIVYEPEAPVFHSHNHSTLGLFKRYFDIGYTLRRLDIWDAKGTKKTLARDAWKMVAGKASHGARRDKAEIVQNLAKSFGLMLGLNQGWLPLALKRHLSAFRLFG